MYKGVKLQRAFTLIELLVVIAIIGLLATVVMTAMSSAREHGRDSKRMKDAQVVYKAAERFYDDYGHFPCYNAGDPQYVYIRSSSDSSNNCLIRDLVPDYLPSVPYDPGGKYAAAFPYEYQRDSNAQAFYIKTTLERGNYTPDVNWPLSGSSCKVNGLPTCQFYGYCRVVPRMLGGAGCGYQYILGDTVN